jgi:alpha,alpha-trehalase
MCTTDKNHITMAKLYGDSNTTAANVRAHTTAAESLKAGILDLLWDPQKVGCYSLFHF